MKNNTLFGIITFLCALIICFIGGEILARYYYIPLNFPSDERNLLYQYDKKLGWFPIPNSDKEFMGSHMIQVKNNSLGFRDIEHGEKKKKRIAFLGDSYLWGYDVEQDERFTEKLRPLLPNYEILNMGVSGYGTDQEFLLLEKWFDHLQPDVVFLLFFSGNDFVDNSSNERYGYYKPYFTINNNKLTLQGTPVPTCKKYFSKEYPTLHKSKLIEFLYLNVLTRKKTFDDPTIPLIKKLKEFVHSKGSTFYLAFAVNADNGQDCHFCKTENIEHVFLTNPFKYTTQGMHWTPKGHDFAKEKLYDFILSKGDEF